MDYSEEIPIFLAFSKLILDDTQVDIFLIS